MPGITFSLNSIDSHLRIVLWDDGITFLFAILSYFCPPLAPLRPQLWGVFEGFNGALLLALKVGGTTATPDAPAPPASQG
jgi:hypothetical protein